MVLLEYKYKDDFFSRRYLSDYRNPSVQVLRDGCSEHLEEDQDQDQASQAGGHRVVASSHALASQAVAWEAHRAWPEGVLELGREVVSCCTAAESFHQHELASLHRHMLACAACRRES